MAAPSETPGSFGSPSDFFVEVQHLVPKLRKQVLERIPQQKASKFLGPGVKALQMLDWIEHLARKGEQMSEEDAEDLADRMELLIVHAITQIEDAFTTPGCHAANNT